MPFVLAAALAAALAWWSWRDRLDQGWGRGAAAARALGFAALLLLLLDPGIARGHADTRPLVLLDNSVSMHAARADPAAAAHLAASLGDTATFGELAPGEPGSASGLFGPLSGALSGGRSVIVVTDGEIADAAMIPADLLAQATVRLVPRPRGADIALTGFRAPLRLAAGDTLQAEVDAVRTGNAPDSADVVVRDSATVLLRGRLTFAGGNRARLQLRGALPRALHGERWLTIERVGPADAEPGDDVRWWRLTVMPTPGVVLLADAPDFDSRALYRTLKDVVEVPVRGYAQLQRGSWRRMDDLRSVPFAEVATAARGADLLAVRGDSRAWRGMGKSRLLWPTAEQPGDWYVSVGGISPVNGAFLGVESDSLPPAVGVSLIGTDSANSWIGAVARLARRGAPVPVVSGRENRGGRSITIGADGLFRWPLRGGVSEQLWRTMISDAATWLLATPKGDSLRARPVTPVVQRGQAVHFSWTGSGAAAPLAIRLRGPGGERSDTLRFDGDGDASLALGVGRYQYTIADGGTGSLAVEPYADELVPGPVTLSGHAGDASRAAPRRSLREVVWIFAVAISAFGAEWMLRRRMGLR